MFMHRVSTRVFWVNGKHPLLPWFSHDLFYCLKQLICIHNFIIHNYSQAKLFHFLGIGKLICKQRNCYYRDAMISRLVHTVESDMGDKRFDLLVTQKIILR